MPTAQGSILQEDFSSGAVPTVAPHLIPENGIYQLRNGFLDEDGSIYRRGGAASFQTHDEQLTFLWRGYLGNTHQTLAADDDSFLVATIFGAMVSVGGNGLQFPRPAAQYNNYLFVGGGTIYAGSSKTANYTTGTIAVTNGSTTVTGSGTTWNTLVDEGMLLQRGNERVYRVASITDTTHLELEEPYEGVSGSGIAYTLSPLYTITTADPYPDSNIYAVSQNRLVWAEDNLLRFAPLAAGFPANHSAHVVTDEWELPENIVGIQAAGAATLVFTTAGIYVVEGIGFDIVDFAGNPQQRLTKHSDQILLDGSGISTWEGGIIAPCTDGVYLFDGISSPTKLSANIDTEYRAYVKLGYYAGQSAVFNSHYFLPLISSDADPKRLYTVQLDRRAFDKRRRLTHPWSWHDGSGGEVSALVADLSADRAPLLLGAQSNTAGDVIDMSGFFTPTEDNALDPDDTAPELDVITRDYATGNGTDNAVKKLRTRYEMTGDDDAEVLFSWSDGAQQTGGAVYGEAVYGTDVYATEGAVFISLDCDGPVSDGRDTHVCRVGQRTRFIRFRLRSIGEIHTLRLRSLEVFIKPSKATRR